MNYRKLITLVLIFSFVLALPVSTWAQTDTIPPVPISDSALRTKEVGITIFGYTIPGLTLDLIAITIARTAIERLVNSTVTWINNGFEGNPTYVTDPRQYFSDLADGIAGNFIAGSDLNFLCSPFQTQIRLALLKSYNQPAPFQCTLTEVVGNIDAFYNDFSQGGWNGWFSMTQNNANNPYGTYVDAKIELDSRIAKKIGLEGQKLDWGKGFLSWQDCIMKDPLTGECLARGPIKTPGTVIEGQLEGVFGTGVRQLELADEFDELVGALISQLLQKTIFSITGLFGGVSGSGGTCPPGWTGTYPNCTYPGGGGGGGGGGGVCNAPPDADKHPSLASFVTTAKEQLTGIVSFTEPPIPNPADVQEFECARYEIVRRAAQLMRAAGHDVGLHQKGGNNCDGFAVDIIAFPDGYLYDVLGGTTGGVNVGWGAATCSNPDGTPNGNFGLPPSGGPDHFGFGGGGGGGGGGTGAVQVESNVATTATVSGPQNYSFSGTSQIFFSAPFGTYSISLDNPACSVNTPSGTTLSTNGQAIFFLLTCP